MFSPSLLYTKIIYDMQLFFIYLILVSDSYKVGQKARKNREAKLESLIAQHGGHPYLDLHSLRMVSLVVVLFVVMS